MTGSMASAGALPVLAWQRAAVATEHSHHVHEPKADAHLALGPRPGTCRGFLPWVCSDVALWWLHQQTIWGSFGKG